MSFATTISGAEALELESLNPVLETYSPTTIVQWAHQQFGDELLMSSSFGAESAVLIHLAWTVNPKIRVVFVDTGFLFDETQAFAETLRKRFDLNLLVYRPFRSAEDYLHAAGETDPGWRSDVERCCAQNKNEPFARALHELKPKAWLRGIRRDQAATRKDRQIVEFSGRFNCYAISPLLRLSTREIHQYLKANDLPWHPLYEKGYASIGCKPSSCTRPIQIGEDARAGRWAGQAKVECGLHL